MAVFIHLTENLMATKQEQLTVFALTEIGPQNTVWDRIGVAYKNRDGSLNVQLRALPVSGRIQIREPKEESDAPEPVDRKPRASRGSTGDPRPS